MKYLLFLIAFPSFCTCIVGQAVNNNEQISKQEDKYKQYIEYTDPAFPVINESEKNYIEIGNYKRALEEYAKNHPPPPDCTNTGYPDADKTNYKILLDNWYANNPYFPRFIQYHLFHKNLTFENDKMFYEKAVEVWLLKNPEIVKKTNK